MNNKVRNSGISGAHAPSPGSDWMSQFSRGVRPQGVVDRKQAVTRAEMMTPEELAISVDLRAKAIEQYTETFNNWTRRRPITFKDVEDHSIFPTKVIPDGIVVKEDIFGADITYIATRSWKTASEAASFYINSFEASVCTREIQNNTEYMNATRNIGFCGMILAHNLGTWVSAVNDMTKTIHRYLLSKGYLFMASANPNNYGYFLFSEDNRLLSFYFFQGGGPFFHSACADMDEIYKIALMGFEGTEWLAPNGVIMTVTGYNELGSFHTKNVILGNNSPMALPEFYPWFKDDIDSYWSEYMDAKQSVLLLIGPAGTGKSTFLRTGIRRSKMKALMCTTPDVFMHPKFIPNCVDLLKQGDIDTIVMEDSDIYIRPRSENNIRMAELLNVTDGIDSSIRGKFIFSTNLKSVDEVDSALLRPGRAFDYLRFDKIGVPDVRKVRAKMGLPPLDFKARRKYTLAEALASTPPSDVNEGIIKPRF